MSLKSPTHLWSGRTVTVFGQGLHQKVVIGDWYRDVFSDVDDRSSALETAYIERGSRGSEPLSAVYLNPADLRLNDLVVLVHDLAGTPMLVHNNEVIDVDQRLHDTFHAQFRTATENIMGVFTTLSYMRTELASALEAVPHLSGVLTALAEKSERLAVLMQKNRNCTDREHLAVRATLGKKIATEFAQEFSGFRYQLLQSRSRHMTKLVAEIGQVQISPYHRQFGITAEQQTSSNLATLVTSMIQLTGDLREPVLDVADVFENSDIPLAMYDVLTRLCADAEPEAAS